MGSGFSPAETGPHELVYHVHGGQLDLHLSHNDGGHVVHATDTGPVFDQQHLQNGGGLERGGPEAGLLVGEFHQHRLGIIQVPKHGPVTDALERLAGLRGAAGQARVFGRWGYVVVG